MDEQIMLKNYLNSIGANTSNIPSLLSLKSPILTNNLNFNTGINSAVPQQLNLPKIDMSLNGYNQATTKKQQPLSFSTKSLPGIPDIQKSSSVGKTIAELGNAKGGAFSNITNSVDTSFLNKKLNPSILQTREAIRSGISKMGAPGAIIGASTKVIDDIGDVFGIGLDTIDKTYARKAGAHTGAVLNDALAMTPGFGTLTGVFAGKTKTADEVTEDANRVRTAYSGSIDGIGELGKKSILFGKRKLNNYIEQKNRDNVILTNIGFDAKRTLSSDYGQDLISQNKSKYSGTINNISTGKLGMKFTELDNARLMIKSFKDKLNNIEYFAEGGKMNVIAEGALHSRKHNLEEVDDSLSDVTKKGIPVITYDDGGDIIQTAEIEREELILTKELTDIIEKLFEENTEESAIKAGKILADELINNTDDKTNKILDEANN